MASPSPNLPGVDASAPQAWRTPVAVQGANGRVVEVVSAKAPKTVLLAAPVTVNAGQTGYFQHLFARAWAKLAPTFLKLSAADQLGLLGQPRPGRGRPGPHERLPGPGATRRPTPTPSFSTRWRASSKPSTGCTPHGPARRPTAPSPAPASP